MLVSDAVEQLARFLGLQHRRLALAHHMRRAAHRGRRINRHDLAVDQPVKQVADGGEPELGGRRLVRLGLLLDPGGDVQRPHVAERGDASGLAPVEKVLHGRQVGAPGMTVADVGGEEFQEPLAGIAIGRGDDRRQCARGGSERDQIRHALPSVSVHDNI